MDEFINSINSARFESTNGLWNELMLNDPWSVGYVATLIEMETFKSKEEWEAFYYNSGENRNVKISGLPSELKEKLNDEQLVLRNKAEFIKLSSNLKSFNFYYGRTRQQIAFKGNILFQHATKNELNIAEEECIEAVRFRTICQTWNGIVIRERNCINSLNRFFPGIDLISTNGEFDHKYAVDYQLKNEGKLICGIQIKPKSYLGKTPYLQKAQSAN